MAQIRTAAFLLTLTVVSLASRTASAQSSSLFREELPPPAHAGYGNFRSPQVRMMQQQLPLDLRSGSWTYLEPIPARQIRIHDRVTVRVDELARMQSEGEMERRRDGSYDAIVQDWINLIGLRGAKPDKQTDGDQRIRAKIQQLYRAEGDLQTRESLALNIACTVVDIRPNGNLVLEGHKQIRVNNDTWEVSLSGVCRFEDVGPDNVVLSRNIANLKLDKRERGHVRDGYKRGWMLRWVDEFHPF